MNEQNSSHSDLLRRAWLPVLLLVTTAAGVSLSAQQSPYFVTYDHHMEEPGSLEIAYAPVAGRPQEGPAYLSQTLELEYGTRAWWTTALYLDSQSTAGERSLFTGVALENRFRLLMKEHAVNPVLYVELGDGNGASRAMKEVVGFDSWRSLAEPVAEGRREHKREIETKLILSRNANGWNLAGNLIGEKNLAGDPWEFGYALGVSRPLALAASPSACSLCRENFSAGVEFYGGLGEWHQVTLANTSHYVAPTVAWSLPNGVTFRLSPTFGVNRNSSRVLLRMAVSYELPSFTAPLSNRVTR